MGKIGLCDSLDCVHNSAISHSLRQSCDASREDTMYGASAEIVQGHWRRAEFL